MEKSKVYFTREITPEAVVRMMNETGGMLTGNIAVKLHSGEVGNQNFLRPEFMSAAVGAVGGTVVECNTAYGGERDTTEKHMRTMEKHGWTKIAPVDIMDADGDIPLLVANGVHLKYNYVGKNLEKYDSMLVLSHFKGHPMGGFGGALKNISIGIASSHGKAVIHGAGDEKKVWRAKQDDFLESMAEAAGTVTEFFGGKMIFVNIMKNMSVDCDCCAVAEDPKMEDIGILSSLDPVALDSACVDLVYRSDDPGKKHLIERMESRHGVHILKTAEALGIGTRDYELIEV
ncbi:MAG: DUF362 domain-containing protein [Clostridia bacterium]|nr:DUF362 domain-containing protein [Clostridia bacterium]